MRKVLFLYFLMLVLIVGRQKQAATVGPVYVSASFQKKEDLSQRWSEEKEHTGKNDGYSRFAEFHRRLRTPDGKAESGYLPNYQLAELGKASERIRNLRIASTNLEWVSRGPGNVPGRTRSLLIMPQDASGNTWLAGSVGGGIWKTTDAGSSWTNVTPDLPNLAISCLALCESDPSVIYAGTGEGFGNLDAIAGAGIFKSTDGGMSWEQLASTVHDESFSVVNRIIVNPANPAEVLACANTSTGIFSGVSSGIYRSEDGGASWTKVYSSAAVVQQLLATPGNFAVQYAAVKGVGVLRSSDSGNTWFATGGQIKAGGRIELAISPNNPEVLAASVVGSLSGEPGADLYYSVDGAQSWIYVSEENNQSFDFLGQGDYDNAIMFHPFSDEVVYVGGVNIFKFTISSDNPSLLKVILAFEKTGTSDFLDFVPFNGNDLPGLELGNVASSEFVDVEIRFGPGIEQKAARFTVDKQGAGVAADDYHFQDYVLVPFQVWDVTNNVQLMASFRDQQEDGAFNLIATNTEGGGENHSREYIFVHLLPYAGTVDENVAKSGGHEYQMLMNFWPVLASGSSWNPKSLPDSKISVSFSEILNWHKSVDVVADGYGEHTSFSGNTVVNPSSEIHVDHHLLMPAQVNAADSTFRIISANDGGVYFSGIGTDPGTSNGDWTFGGNAMVTGQLYGVDRRWSSGQYIGGLQDNSTVVSSSDAEVSAESPYTTVVGGDGFETIWNNANENEVIASAQFNTFFRSENYGAPESWQPAVSGLPFDNYEQDFPFFSRLANSRSLPEVLFTVGAGGVYRSQDFGKNWVLRPVEGGWSYRGSFTNVEVSLANPNVIWAGGAMSGSETLQLSTDGGETFRKVQNYTGNAQLQGVVTGIESHPFDEQTAFALFSFKGLPKVLRTQDQGQSWHDISGFENNASASAGFPDVAVYSLLVLPSDPATIWAGTEIGIFETSDDGASWQRLQGFPAVAVWEMKVVNDEVVVATHGRGIWTAQLSGVSQPILVPAVKSVGIKPSGAVVAQVELRSPYDSSLVVVNGEVVQVLGANGSSQTQQVTTFWEGNEVTFEIRSYSAGRLYTSLPQSAYAEYEAPVESYVNTFDSDEGLTDFYGEGFSISKPAGFQSKAIHSRHSYDDDANYTWHLRFPVVVKSSDAWFSYRDIAIIEKGESGSVFGEAEFFDYVVVEGTTDGANWIPLADGYDASYYPAWGAAYASGGKGNEALYVRHELDLLQHFNPGDTVAFRFRLFSDQAENAWGWAIDDLAIQEQIKTGVGQLETFKISVYPNPVSDFLNIDFQGNHSPVTLTLFDLTGKVIWQSTYLRAKQASIDLSALKSGVYVLHARSNEIRTTAKVIKG